MANTNFEKYIEGLSPELQEKARACKTKEELNEFIENNDLELPEEALEIVSGGCGTSTKHYYCKYCGSIVNGYYCQNRKTNYSYICDRGGCGRKLTSEEVEYR